MFIQDRLISRSSRSLAVMIGFARSAKNGREGLRGSPDDALNEFVFRTAFRSSAANPRFQFG